MTYIFYTSFSSPFLPDALEQHLRKFPPNIRKSILSFRKWEDVHRSLLGKLLLLAALEQLNLSAYSLDQLRYSAFQKPFFDESLDFNISHSGAYIVCALSLTHKLGIDVEHIKPIAFDDFLDNFHPTEWQHIRESPDSLRSFYAHWTQKEAFLKAVGVGLNAPLHEITFPASRIAWEDKTWFSTEILLAPDYACHLVTDTQHPTIVLERLAFS